MPTEAYRQSGVSTVPAWRGIALFFKFASLEYRRNFTSLTMTLLAPAVFVLIYGFFYWSSRGVPPDLVVAFAPSVPPQTRTALAASAPRGIAFLPTATSGEDALQQQHARFAIDVDRRTGALTLYANELDVTVANLISHALLPDRPAQKTSGASLQVALIPRKAVDFAFFPGILVMALMNIGLFTGGNKLLQDRANGTLRFFRQLPLSMSFYVIGELLLRLVLATVLTALLLAVGYMVFDITIGIGRLLAAFVVSICVAVPLLMLGYTLGALLGSYSRGTHVFTVVNLFLAFAGDLFFPLSQMEVSRPVVALLPTAHCVNLLRIVMLKSAPSFPPFASAAYVLGFSLLCLFIVRRRLTLTAEE